MLFTVIMLSAMNENFENNFVEAHVERSEALQWWAALPPEDRVIYTEAHHGEERHPMTLTGSEILDIYRTAIS